MSPLAALQQRFSELDGNTLLKLILTHRNYLMGIAMLIVLLFHFGCWVYNPLGKLNIGFIGVDLFLFLSGLGLSLSYEKHTLRQFYTNRLKRIYPVYFIAVSITYFLVSWSPRELINNYLTLGFYTDGGHNRYDWYLESLFSFYLLFPLFFYLARFKHYALAVLFVLTFGVLAAFPDFFNASWWYKCFLSRFPIFLYGAMFRYALKSVKTVALIGIALYLPTVMIASQFLATSLLALPLLIASLWLLKYLSPRLQQFVVYCGKHSLEIYCANCLLQIVMDLYIPNPMYRFLPYWVLQILFSAVFIGFNQSFSKLLK